MPSKRLLLFPFEMKKLRLRKAESRITQPSRTELEPPVSEGTPRPFLGRAQAGILECRSPERKDSKGPLHNRGRGGQRRALGNPAFGKRSR